MISGVGDKENILSLHVEYPVKGFDWILEFLFRQGAYNDNEVAFIINIVSPLLDVKDRKKLSTLFDSSTVNSVLTASDKKRESLS